MGNKVEKTKSPFDSEIEDETIALSKDELDNILAEAEIVQDKGRAGKGSAEEMDIFEEGGGKVEPAGEEFDISGEIDELSPEDLESIELEEGEVDAFTKELEGEFGEEFDLSDTKGDAKVEDIADIEAEELNLGAELGEDEDLDSYLDTVKSDIDLEAIDLEEGEAGLVESPVLGETEGLGEGELLAGEAFKEAGIEVTDEAEKEESLADLEEGLGALGKGTALDEELSEIGESLTSLDDLGTAGAAEEGLGLEGLEGLDLKDEPKGAEVELTEDEEELLSKDFDLPIEGEPESEEVVTVSGDELERMVEGKPIGSGKGARGEAEQPSVDSTLLNDITVILKYMDSLLEDLPEERIKEFAKSKYFALYREVFEKLNIG